MSLRDGRKVMIHTTRKAEDIASWLVEHGFPALEVHNEKWSRIDVFVDDRAQEFVPARLADADAYARELLAFEPHWRRPA